MNTKNIFFPQKNFNDFLPVIQHAEVKLSYFGKRCCLLHNGKTVSIDDIALKMIDLLHEHPHFTEQERMTVKKISSLIDKLYISSDEQVRNAFFLTRIIVWIRELFDGRPCIRSCSEGRWFWSRCEEINVPGYSRAAYSYTQIQLEKKGEHAPMSPEWKDLGRIGKHQRWMLSQS